MSTPPTQPSQPTSEFEGRCNSILQRWQSGDLDFAGAYRALQGLKSDARDSGIIVHEARAEHILGYLQHQRGRLDGSITHYEQAITQYKLVGSTLNALSCSMNQGENYRLKGQFTHALKLYQDIAVTAHNAGYLVHETIAVVNEGHIWGNVEKYDRAYERYTTAQTMTTEWTDRLHLLPALRTEIFAGLVTLYLAKQDYPQAFQQALAALGQAAQAENAQVEGLAHRIIGEVLIDYTPSTDETATHALRDVTYYLDTALEAFREIKAEGEMARVILVQAIYAAKTGNRKGASDLFRSAMLMFTRLGMVIDASKVTQLQIKYLR